MIFNDISIIWLRNYKSIRIWNFSSSGLGEDRALLGFRYRRNLVGTMWELPGVIAIDILFLRITKEI